MNSNTESRPTLEPELAILYTFDSLHFARSVTRELEHELKAKAKQLTLEDGRNTITEDDMRRAADEIFGTVDGEFAEPDADDA